MMPHLALTSKRPAAWDKLTGDPVARELVERYNVQKFDEYMNGHSARAFNVAVITKSLEASLEALRKPGQRGKRLKPDQLMHDSLSSSLNKYVQHEEAASRMLEIIADAHPAEPRAKRTKKISRKQSASAGVEIEHSYKEATVSYTYTMGDHIRTTLQSTGVAAQRCPRRVLQRLCPDTVELNIENSLCTILHQLFQKIKVVPPMPAKLKALHDHPCRCHHDRVFTLS